MSPPNDRPTLLSKSRFLAGLQCLKRLYLDCYHRDLAGGLSPSQQAIFDTGNLVGSLARQRFPGGALIEEPYFEHEKAEYRTQTLLRDSSFPALFEPAFNFAGIRTRVDILLRTSGRAFDLIEVKSTASAKEQTIGAVATTYNFWNRSETKTPNRPSGSSTVRPKTRKMTPPYLPWALKT